MECISYQYVNAVTRQAVSRTSHSFLVVPREDQLVIVNEAVVVVTCYVRRIQENQVAWRGIQQRVFEIV